MPAVVTRGGILGNRYSSIRGGMHGPQGGYGVSIYDLCQ